MIINQIHQTKSESKIYINIQCFEHFKSKENINSNEKIYISLLLKIQFKICLQAHNDDKRSKRDT